MNAVGPSPPVLSHGPSAVLRVCWVNATDHMPRPDQATQHGEMKNMMPRTLITSDLELAPTDFVERRCRSAPIVAGRVKPDPSQSGQSEFFECEES